MDFSDGATSPKPAQRISPKYGRSVLSSFQREEGKEATVPNANFKWPTLPATTVFEINNGTLESYTIHGKDSYTPHHFIHVIPA